MHCDAVPVYIKLYVLDDGLIGAIMKNNIVLVSTTPDYARECCVPAYYNIVTGWFTKVIALHQVFHIALEYSPKVNNPFFVATKKKHEQFVVR